MVDEGLPGLRAAAEPGGLRSPQPRIVTWADRDDARPGRTSNDGGRQVSPSAGGADVQLGDRLGLKPGMVVQELGWDEDVDDSVREMIENAIDADLVDGDHGDVVDLVLLWWRDDDGDLVDALV